MRLPFCIRIVTGHSMEPTLHEGTYIIFRAALRYNEGDIVIARHNNRDIVKRVKQVTDEQVYLVGDNTQHAHVTGWVDKSVVFGKRWLL